MADTVGFREDTRHETVRLAARLVRLLEAEQEQWFLWLPVTLGVGIALYFALPREPALWLVGPMLVVAVLLHAFGRSAGHWSLMTGALLAAALGFALAKVRTERASAPVLARQIGPVEVVGWLERVEPRATGGQRVTVRVVGFGEGARETWPQRVRVRLRDGHATLEPGQAIKLKATLGPPPPPAAPHDFDFGRQAWFAGLGGIGFTSSPVERIEGIGAPPWSLAWSGPVERLRQAIRARITEALPGETGEIATALITGERGGISEATNQAYRDSGLFHILSISGLHMVIMAGAVFYVLRLGLAVFPSIALRYPIKKWAAVGAILGAFGYLMISGAAFATVRSYVMITIMFLAVLLDRPAIALRNVALAALAILVVYPESLLDAGFQMSFAAVTGLVSAYEWLRRRREARGNAGAEEAGPVRRAGRFVGEIVLSTVIASAVVAPFGIYHFHNTQLLALVGNVLAIPICNLIVMPAALAVLLLLPVGFEWLALAVMGFGIDLMTAVARWVGAMPGAVAKVPAIPTSAFAAMVTGGLWLLLWQRAWRIAGLVPIAIGILLAPTLNRPDVLIGRDGSTVAVRGADGRLAALAGRATSFEVARWLELDGDRRPAVEVIATTAPAFSCDGVGCLATTSGKRVAIATTPAALRDDCPMADVVVLRFASGPKCGTVMRATQVVLEPSDLARRGAHAIYVTKTGLRIETVADARGQRPWSGALVPQEASEIIP